MSLGPAFIRLAARSTNFFEISSPQLAEAFNDPQSVVVSVSEAGITPGAFGDPSNNGTAPPFSPDKYEENFFKRGDLAQRQEASGAAGPLGSGSLDLSALGPLAGSLSSPENSVADFTTDSLFGEYDPDAWFANFPARDLGPPSLSKTYQKLHRALKAMSAREVD